MKYLAEADSMADLWAGKCTIVPLVTCKDCKHRIVNKHYGEKGYVKLKATCELDTGNPFELSRCAENDEWFCADAERKDEVKNDKRRTARTAQQSVLGTSYNGY